VEKYSEELRGRVAINYLLQVWRRKDGIMLYERKLSQRLKGWGMNQKVFLYQEDDGEDGIFEIWMLKIDEESSKLDVVKINLPDQIKSLQNTKGDAEESA